MRAVPRFIEKELARKRLYCLFLVLTLSDLTSAFLWLGIYREQNFPTTTNNSADCLYVQKNYNITKKQLRICNRRESSMPYVHEAARLAVRTCQSIFRFKRWNCSTLSLLPKEVLPELKTATKERAFVDAISAAALTYTLARACAAHTISECTCGSYPKNPPDGAFKWGGCGDNVHWGTTFSREFFENRKYVVSRPNSEEAEDARRRRRRRRRKRRGTKTSTRPPDNSKITLFTRIQIHNSDVGRQIVKKGLKTSCMCHGVSGACDVKTCWKQLPLGFHELEDRLMLAYKNAEMVHGKLQVQHLDSRAKGMSNSLVYTSNVDYCKNANHFYTRGRMCNSTAEYADNCDHMCCYQGHNRREIRISRRCNCRYNPNWVNVSCDKCVDVKFANICD